MYEYQFLMSETKPACIDVVRSTSHLSSETLDDLRDGYAKLLGIKSDKIMIVPHEVVSDAKRAISGFSTEPEKSKPPHSNKEQ